MNHKKDVGFWENVGTEAEPKYAGPKEIKCWGKRMTLSCLEQTCAAVDWYGTVTPSIGDGHKALRYGFSTGCGFGLMHPDQLARPQDREARHC